MGEMESLTQFIVPIVSLWVIHNAIFNSAKFVNKMRETVISGKYNQVKLSIAHRSAIHLDWGLCIAATILVCVIFALIVLKVSNEILEGDPLMWVGIAIAAYPIACAFGFFICSLNDHKLMREAVGSRRILDWIRDQPGRVLRRLRDLPGRVLRWLGLASENKA